MRKVGKLTTATVVVLTVFGLFVGWRSIPDIQRYLKMRSM